MHLFEILVDERDLPYEVLDARLSVLHLEVNCFSLNSIFVECVETFQWLMGWIHFLGGHMDGMSEDFPSIRGMLIFFVAYQRNNSRSI